MQTGPKQAGLHCSPGQHLRVAERPKHGSPAGMQMPSVFALLVTSLPLFSIPWDKASGILTSSALAIASIEVTKAERMRNFCMLDAGVCVHTSPDKVGTVATQIYRYTTLLHAGKSRNFTMDRFGDEQSTMPFVREMHKHHHRKLTHLIHFMKSITTNVA